MLTIYRPKGEAQEYAPYGLNLYAGCSHGCRYCYNKGKFDGLCTELMHKATLNRIEADLRDLAFGGNRDPVHLSFVGDPYDRGRSDNEYTRKVLELFQKYQHPFQILTKGGTIALLDLDLYFEGCRFGCTLTFNNEDDSKDWEPGAALPADRIEALRIAHDYMEISTWVSLEPVIDPAQTLALIEATHDCVDFYGVGKLNHNHEHEKSIDWRKFRADAETLLRKYNKNYIIKKALAET
jgi:DNA repair photolyase